MTFSKRSKAIGSLALALAAVTTLSVSAFAQETSEVPMAKIVPSTEVSLLASGTEDNNTVVGDITKSVPVKQLTEAEEGELLADESTALVIETRTNETTGELEISEDGGKTWTEFDGKAIECTMALAK